MQHAFRCECGKLKGHVLVPVASARAACYCVDCRTFAHALGQAKGVVDDSGGTNIVAMPPSHIRFDEGIEELACLSLTENGLLRWYARCCNTPIGNTPRDHKVHYLGLIDFVLERPVENDFGPVTARLNTGSALRPVAATRFATAAAIARIARWMLPARFTGRWRETPFFDTSGKPARDVRVLSAEELAAARKKASA